MWGNILGALVAGLIGVLTAYVFRWLDRRDRVAIITQLLIDELEQSVSVYQDMIDIWIKYQLISDECLSRLFNYRFIYNKNAEYVHLLKDKILRRDIFRYYADSSRAIDLLKDQNQRLLTARLDIEKGVKNADEFEKKMVNVWIPDNFKQLKAFKAQASELAQRLNEYSGNRFSK